MDTQLSTLMNIDAVSPWVLAIAGVLGLAMCLCGRKLARSVVTTSGLALGGIMVFVMPKQPMDPAMLLLWVAGGCLVGAVIAFVLFRIMTGLIFAAILMLLLPWAALLSTNQLPTFELPTSEVLISDIAPAEPEDADTDEAQLDADTDSALPMEQRIRKVLDRVINTQQSAAADWWHELGRSGQYTVTFCAGAGLLIGLIIGIIGPYFTASILFALSGASLLLTSAIIADIQPLNTHLPQSAPGQLAVVCLITTVGVAMQWTNFNKKTDKS